MKKYFRILLIAVLAAVMVFAAVPAFAEEPAVDISIDTPITMSEIYATEMKNENGESVRMFWDWAMYGTFTATVDGVVYENITGQQFEEILRNTKYSVRWKEVDEQSPEAPWTVGQSNSCVLHVDSPTEVEIPCEVIVTETDIVSVTGGATSYYAYQKRGSAGIVVTYANGTTSDLPEGVSVTFPDGWPTKPGEHSVRVIVGNKFETFVQATVLENPSNGKLGESIEWSYDEKAETMYISGKGAMYGENDSELADWVEIFMGLAPKHVVVEEGVEELTAGVFHYGFSVETLTLPSTLKDLPDALIGWNGPTEGLYFEEEYGVLPGMTSITVPEGITSLTNSTFYLCWGITDYYLPATLTEIDLDTLCFAAYNRIEMGLPDLGTTIHFAGTEEEWNNIKYVTGSRTYSTGKTDDELEKMFASFKVVFNANENDGGDEPEQPGESEQETEIFADAYDMTYYVGGYGAMPNRYQLQIRQQDGGWAEWYDISYGDALVSEWPTEVGNHTVTFDKTAEVDGIEYTFNVSMNITVLELPATSGKCGDTMTWKFDTATDTLTISGTGDMYTIVENYDAFYNEEYVYEPGWWYLPVKHIVVEEGVENLPDFAFAQNWNGYYKLHETIELPTTLKKIPELGFLMSTALESLTIPEGITSLTGWPFGSPGNSFTSVTELYLPSTLKEMDISTLMIAGLDNRTAAVSLKKIHFAGTEEEWNAITRVESEINKKIFGDSYESIYENFLKPIQEMFVDVEIVFEPIEGEESGEEVQPEEDITVEDGTATVPDSKVEVTDNEDVVIDVSGTEETVSSVVIGSETLDKIANAESAVEIKLPEVTVVFDKTAVGSISKQAVNGAVTIVAKEIEETVLNETQKEAIADQEICMILTLEAFAGESKISEFDGGKVTVTVPFEVPAGKTGDQFYVAYIAADGTMTVMPTVYADGKLSFETTHFSDYAILEKTTSDDNSGSIPPSGGEPATGGNGNLIPLIVLVLLSAAGMAVCFWKRRAF